MIDILVKGGPVLWVIIVLGLIAAVIIVERLIYFRKIHTDEETLFARVRSALEHDHIDEALAICDNNVSPLASLMRVGIEYRDFPEDTQKEMIKDTASQEEPRLERNLGFIATVIQISPLLGLLGTVTGTIKAFGVLGSVGAGADPSVLAKGVAEALITTAGGLIVAVPCAIMYNFMVTKVDLILSMIERQATALILMINSTKAKSALAAASRGSGRPEAPRGYPEAGGGIPQARAARPPQSAEGGPGAMPPQARPAKRPAPPRPERPDDPWSGGVL